MLAQRKCKYKSLSAHPHGLTCSLLTSASRAFFTASNSYLGVRVPDSGTGVRQISRMRTFTRAHSACPYERPSCGPVAPQPAPPGQRLHAVIHVGLGAAGLGGLQWGQGSCRGPGAGVERRGWETAWWREGAGRRCKVIACSGMRQLHAGWQSVSTQERRRTSAAQSAHSTRIPTTLCPSPCPHPPPYPPPCR